MMGLGRQNSASISICLNSRSSYAISPSRNTPKSVMKWLLKSEKHVQNAEQILKC